MLTVTGQTTQCVFEAQGKNMTGSSVTEEMTKSLSDCQSACSADSICLAVTHRSEKNVCRKHNTTETTSIGCADCTFYLKLCGSTTSMSTFSAISFQLLFSFFHNVVLCQLLPTFYVSHTTYCNYVHEHSSRIACLLFLVDI